MTGAKEYIARNKAWMIPMTVAGMGYLSLQLLIASQLYEEGTADVPLWVWSPLVVTSIGVAITLFSLFLCKTKTARVFRFLAAIFVVAMMLDYTVGFAFNF